MSEVIQRKWQLHLGPLQGKRGEVRTLDVRPSCRFELEKMAYAGSIATIVRFLVDGIDQKVPGPKDVTEEFQFTLARIQAAVCKGYGSGIILQVQFKTDGVFWATVFGKVSDISFPRVRPWQKS